MKTFGIVMLAISGLVVLSAIGIGCHFLNIGVSHVSNSLDNAVVDYDEYWDIYNTCKKLNTDLGIVENTPDQDKQFDQFSKAQRENAIKQNLNRWVAEYNAKSRHIDKRWWKSGDLPYELSVNNFSNYNK